MKKLLLTIILFWITGHSYSQLTNAEVYNFEIGDVLQTKRTSVGTPGYLYELDTIVDKVVGSGIITYSGTQFLLDRYHQKHPALKHLS